MKEENFVLKFKNKSRLINILLLILMLSSYIRPLTVAINAMEIAPVAGDSIFTELTVDLKGYVLGNQSGLVEVGFTNVDAIENLKIEFLDVPSSWKVITKQSDLWIESPTNTFKYKGSYAPGSSGVFGFDIRTSDSSGPNDDFCIPDEWLPHVKISGDGFDTVEVFEKDNESMQGKNSTLYMSNYFNPNSSTFTEATKPSEIKISMDYYNGAKSTDGLKITTTNFFLDTTKGNGLLLENIQETATGGTYYFKSPNLKEGSVKNYYFDLIHIPDVERIDLAVDYTEDLGGCSRTQKATDYATKKVDPEFIGDVLFKKASSEQHVNDTYYFEYGVSNLTSKYGVYYEDITFKEDYFKNDAEYDEHSLRTSQTIKYYVADNQTASGTITVTYKDNSTQVFNLPEATTSGFVGGTHPICTRSTGYVNCDTKKMSMTQDELNEIKAIEYNFKNIKNTEVRDYYLVDNPAGLDDNDNGLSDDDMIQKNTVLIDEPGTLNNLDGSDYGFTNLDEVTAPKTFYTGPQEMYMYVEEGYERSGLNTRMWHSIRTNSGKANVYKEYVVIPYFENLTYSSDFKPITYQGNQYMLGDEYVNITFNSSLPSYVPFYAITVPIWDKPGRFRGDYEYENIDSTSSTYSKKIFDWAEVDIPEINGHQENKTVAIESGWMTPYTAQSFTVNKSVKQCAGQSKCTLAPGDDVQFDSLVINNQIDALKDIRLLEKLPQDEDTQIIHNNDGTYTLRGSTIQLDNIRLTDQNNKELDPDMYTITYIKGLTDDEYYNLIADPLSIPDPANVTTDITEAEGILIDCKDADGLKKNEFLQLELHAITPTGARTGDVIMNSFGLGGVQSGEPIAPTESNNVGVEIERPVLPEFKVTKDVEISNDQNGDGILNTQDTLTYKIVTENVGDETGEVLIQDELLDTEFAQVVPSNFTITGGSEYDPIAPTIGSLKSGIKVTLDAKETNTISFDIVIPETGFKVTDYLIENTVVISPTDGGICVDYICEDNADIELVTYPIFSVEKSSELIKDANKDEMLSPGDTLEYSILTKNVGDEPGTVSIKDELLDSEFTDSVISSFRIKGGKNITPNNPTIEDLKTGIEVTLKPGETNLITFEVKVPSVGYEITAGEIENTAVITPITDGAICQDNICEDTVTNPYDLVNPIPLLPTPEPTTEFSVTKDVEISNDQNGDGILNTQDTLTYKIVTENVGDQTGEVLIQDELLDTEFAQVLPSNFTITGGSKYDPIAPTIGSLKSGIKVTLDAKETNTITFDIVIPETGFKVTDYLIENTVVIAPTDGGICVDYICEDSADIELVTYPIFSVEKSSELIKDLNQDEMLSAGDTLEYSILTKNVGDEPGVVSIKDELLDSEFTDSVISNFRIKGGKNITPTNPTIEDLKTGIEVTLKPGETNLITFEVKVPSIGYEITAGEIENTAVVTPITEGAICLDNICEDTVTNPYDFVNPTPLLPTVDPTSEFNIVKEAEILDDDNNDILNVGETLKYTITTTNTGFGTGSVTIIDPLSDTEFDDATISNFTITGGSDYEPTNPSISDLKEGITVTLAPEQTNTITFEFMIPEGGFVDSDGVIENTATINVNPDISSCLEESCESTIDVVVDDTLPENIQDVDNENSKAEIISTGITTLATLFVLLSGMIMMLGVKRKND